MARATRSTAAAVGRRAGGRSVPPAPEAQKQQRRGGAHAAAKRPVAAATPPGGGAATTAASPPAELQAKADRIAKSLAEMYPDPPIPLDHGNTFQFLCAVVLSAQSTDKKVNTVTPKLFAAAPTAHAMAELSIDTVKEYIKEIGLANSKAKYLVNLSKQLLELHDGEVPSDFKALEALPGVGHKTASVIMGQAFGIDAFPVDTHIHRLAARWGLSNGTTVERTEADLKALFPPESWRDLHLQIIFYGREHGQASQSYPWSGPICTWAGLEDPPATTPAKKRRAKEEAGAGKATGKKPPKARKKL
eukprot:PRCOL_00001550-RA